MDLQIKQAQQQHRALKDEFDTMVKSTKTQKPKSLELFTRCPLSGNSWVPQLWKPHHPINHETRILHTRLHHP